MWQLHIPEVCLPDQYKCGTGGSYNIRIKYAAYEDGYKYMDSGRICSVHISMKYWIGLGFLPCLYTWTRFSPYQWTIYQDCQKKAEGIDITMVVRKRLTTQ